VGRKASSGSPAPSLPAWLSTAPLLTLGVAASAAACLRFGSLGDYPQFAQAAVNALSHGDLRGVLAHPALMGPLSLILRAPAVAVARLFGGGALAGYDAGAFLCVVSAALLAIGLTLPARPLAPRPIALLLLVVFAVFNPATVGALEWGHPEEVLTGALSVAAVALATRDRYLMAAITLGLALAAKQWAILAVVPTLLAVPAPRRTRVVALAGAIAALLTLPFLVGNPAGFVTTLHHAANADPGNVVTPFSWWFFAAHPLRLHLPLAGGATSELKLYLLPAWVVESAHLFIVALAGGAAALIYHRRRSHSDALLGLALVFLLRCALDPVDTVYYNVPLVLTLLAWETLTLRRTLPVATLLSSAALWVTFDLMAPNSSANATGLAYGGWTALLLLYLFGSLHSARGETASRTRAGLAAAA
jgi:hypothetical protein